MKQGRTVTLNDKGILLVCVVILSLTFALGFMTSSKRKAHEDVTVFTSEDLERIDAVRAIDGGQKSGMEIYAYKDENENLMVGWTFGDQI